MEKLLTVLQVIVPIFAAILLGFFARRRQLITPQENRGLQQFVTKFCLPCVLFNSCLNSDFGPEAVPTMALLLPLLFLSSFFAFRARKGKRFPYYNLPFLFTAQESGMLGIPLFLVLFGADQAFRMSLLDMSQALVAIPVLTFLTSSPGTNPTPKQIVKQLFTSPLLLMSLLGLALNLTGAADVLNRMGIGGILTETTSFLAQPVSAVILFAVGYNFSLGEGSRGQIFRLSAIHMGVFALICGIIQGLLCLLPQVAAETRWAVLLYCMLPASFLTPGLGRNEEEYTIASGVCSLLTVVTLTVFCIMAVLAM